MMNSTQELYSPSEQTIVLLCNVARQYAAMRHNESAMAMRQAIGSCGQA